jgi:SH3 domain protein
VIKKLILLSLIIFVASGQSVFAKTMYTSDITEISVRQGRDTSYPVIKTLKSNEPVTVLESSNGWSKIQLPDGKEGWLISSYLTDKAPPSPTAPEAGKKMEQITLQLEATGAENERLKKEIQSLKAQLDNNLKNLANLQASVDGNPADSEEFLALKAKLNTISAEAKEKTDKIKELEKQLAGVGKDPGQYKCYLYLFLAGAGVLLLGMMIGSSAKRRRSSLL